MNLSIKNIISKFTSTEIMAVVAGILAVLANCAQLIANTNLFDRKPILECQPSSTPVNDEWYFSLKVINTGQVPAKNILVQLEIPKIQPTEDLNVESNYTVIYTKSTYLTNHDTFLYSININDNTQINEELIFTIKCRNPSRNRFLNPKLNMTAEWEFLSPANQIYSNSTICFIVLLG